VRSPDELASALQTRLSELRLTWTTSSS